MPTRPFENSVPSSFETAPLAFLEQTQGCVWMVDLRGVTVFVNESMARALGYRREEMIGRSVFEYMDAESQATTAANLVKRRNGLSATRTVHMIHKSGVRIPMIVAANPLQEPDGRIVGSFAILTEIAQTSSPRTMRFENLEIDFQALEARIDGRTLELSAFSFKLLKYFVENAGRAIPRSELMEKVWEDASLTDRLIDAHIVSLRKKLEGFFGEIRTVYGIGYRLKAKQSTGEA